VPPLPRARPGGDARDPPRPARPLRGLLRGQLRLRPLPRLAPAAGRAGPGGPPRPAAADLPLLCGQVAYVALGRVLREIVGIGPAGHHITRHATASAGTPSGPCPPAMACAASPP